MRLTARQYAIALYELTEQASEKEAKKMIILFLKKLFKTHQLSLLPKVLTFYSDYYDKKEGIIELKIQSVRRISKPIKDYLKKQFTGEKVIFKEKIDEKILGGLVIQWRDNLFDASLKNKLEILAGKLSV